MGLGLRLLGETGRGFLGRRRDPARVCAGLGRALQGAAQATDPIWTACVNVRQLDDRVLVSLHPAEEEVEFLPDEKGPVVSARTVGAGPGYHQWLVQLLEKAGAACSVTWRSTGEANDSEFLDETGYFEC